MQLGELHELDELSFANLQDAILQLLGLNVVCLRRDRIAVELYATAIDEAYFGYRMFQPSALLHEYICHADCARSCGCYFYRLQGG